MNKLSQELENALKYSHIEIPSYIRENLSKELRAYQEQALRHYLLQRQKPQTNHLMFNMATGSGKTLMMAALMLDLYKNGYRDFVFFVNSTAILEKTKVNFADKSSSKYLFKERILIHSSEVEINVIENLSESKEACINIYFSTIQGLFSLLKYEKENALSLEDFENRKIVFLADEAHHLNVDTEKSNKEKEIKENWESIIKKAFESNPKNLMLEFTATIPKTPAVLEKYQDKIIYEYDLKRFCNDGYSKRIFLMKYENQDLHKRFLGALISSLFRELLAQKHGIALKPVVMFKSEAINSSKDNERLFVEFLKVLNSQVIEEFYAGIDLKGNELFAKSLEFFKNEFQEAYLEKIALHLKNNFKPIYILNTNDESELAKNQILLNSLEDSGNEIRVIFAVDRLNEGWDVLNLFDIVRLGSKKSKAVTTKEAQLIGRGARYYPFMCEATRNFDGKADKRKFDSDLENDLGVLERLSYHTINDVDFISDLNKSLREQGLPIEEQIFKIELIPNKKVLDKLQNNKVFYAKNRRIKKQDLEHFQIPKEEIASKMRALAIPLFSSNIEEKEERFEESKEGEEPKSFTKITDKIESKYFLKAMNMLGLSFASLKEDFACESKDEFIKKFLGDITFEFAKKQEFRPANNLKIALFILEHFKNAREKIKMEYEVTPLQVASLPIHPRTIFRSSVDKFENLNDYEWLCYTQCSFDSKLEKSFLDFIESKKDEINAEFSIWFVVRNDGFEEFKLYDNRKDTDTYGWGFEPDFIFFGKRRGKKESFLSIECFIEVKGEHLAGSGDILGVDAWKERFLESLQYQKIEIEDKLREQAEVLSEANRYETESKVRGEAQQMAGMRGEANRYEAGVQSEAKQMAEMEREVHLTFQSLPFFRTANDRRFQECFEAFMQHSQTQNSLR